MGFKSLKFSVHARSRFHDWQTPRGIFDSLDREFHFEIDAAADDSNHLCDRYFTKNDDALIQDWAPSIVFVNPPFGRLLPLFVAKAALEAARGATVVMLLPVRTDTEIWHSTIIPFAEVRFIRGRLEYFGRKAKGGKHNGAPFPTAIVIFRPAREGAVG